MTSLDAKLSYRRRIAHAAADAAEPWWSVHLSVWSAALILLVAGKACVLGLVLSVVLVGYALAAGLSAAHGWSMLYSFNGLAERRTLQLCYHGLGAMVAVALMYGLLETEFAVRSVNGPLAVWLSKSIAILLSSLTFAVVVLGLQVSFRAKTDWPHGEVFGTFTVKRVWLKHRMTRAELWAELVNADRTCFLQTNLSTTNPVLKQDVSMALALTAGAQVRAVEVAGHVALLQIGASEDIG